MPVTENTPMNPEEIELSHLLKEYKITKNVLLMMKNQLILNITSANVITIDVMEKYIERLKNLQIEIKVLALQNPSCLPEGVNRENFDTIIINK